jgi:hypothetical protein
LEKILGMPLWSVHREGYGMGERAWVASIEGGFSMWAHVKRPLIPHLPHIWYTKDFTEHVPLLHLVDILQHLHSSNLLHRQAAQVMPILSITRDCPLVA